MEKGISVYWLHNWLVHHPGKVISVCRLQCKGRVEVTDMRGNFVRQKHSPRLYAYQHHFIQVGMPFYNFIAQALYSKI